MLASLSPGERETLTKNLSPQALKILRYDWEYLLARPEQLAPEGDWHTWLIKSGRGWGKALALDTPLPTPSGWTTMGEVRVGDELFDERGEPCRVTFATAVMEGRTCYEVAFSDGTTVIADAEHQWLTWTHAARKAAARARTPRARPRVVTTEQIRGTLFYGGRERNHAVPVSEPVQCVERRLPIDPYVLGAWLGDGSSASAEITTMDEGLLAEIRGRGYQTRKRGSDRCGKADIYWITRAGQPEHRRDPNTGRFTGTEGGLQTELKRLSLIRNKHVPAAYLRASARQRLALLQGLMDTDGSVQEGGFCEFLCCCLGLAEGVFELAASLGLKPTWAAERATLKGKDCGPRYRVSFTAHIPVFRLARKLCRQHTGKSQKDRNQRRYVVRVEPVPSVPVRCIQVDSPSSLFLCSRAFIPTHNTRCGAEWVRARAFAGFRRLALIGQTAADVRDVMIHGPSGVLTISPPWFMPKYEPSKRLLTWPNGAEGHTYSGDEPDQLRGPGTDSVWADEPAKWKYVRETWDNMEFGLREGPQPQVLATTTPRPIPLIRELLADPTCVVTDGSTFDNAANLAPSFLARLRAKYSGTRLGRQELEGQVLEDRPGALWQRAALDALRVATMPALRRVVVGVDPSVADGDSEETAECGIVVGALGVDGHGYVLDDASLRGSPNEWAMAVVAAYSRLRADRVVAEKNQGGALVESTLRTVAPHLPYKGVHASRNKEARAEPVSALYEQGRIHHVGAFPALEDQLCEWVPGEKSPDRLDALVWAFTELFNLAEPAANPLAGLLIHGGVRGW